MSDASSEDIRAVEFGDVLPRVEAGPSKWPSLAVGLGLSASTAALALGLSGPARLASVPLGLGAIGAMCYPFVRTDAEAYPRFPGLDLKHFERIDPECAVQHLTGGFSGPARGLPGGEIVIARVTSANAERLKQVAHKCSRHWDEDALHRVLIAVPSASPGVVEDVADAYDATILVDAADIDAGNLGTLLRYLPDILTEEEGAEIEGIGSVTIRQVTIGERGPGDPGLSQDLEMGQGKPLSPFAEHLRDQTQPAVTLLSAPEDYLAPAISVLDEENGVIAPVAVSSGGTVELARFFLSEEFPEMDWPFRRTSFRDGDADGAERVPRPSGGERPDGDAPVIDPSLNSRCRD